MESKAGTGLITGHAKRLGIDLAKLMRKGGPGGGDYMRMWTKALVEDDDANVGRNFDAFYCLGPRDVYSFFTQGESRTLTAAVEVYLAQEFATEASFRDAYSVPNIKWGAASSSTSVSDPRNKWKQQRMDFLRFYGLRASANFGLGRHDEWAILRLLNERRRQLSANSSMLDGDVGDQLAGFFDGNQVDPSSSEAGLSRGYAR